MFAFWSLIVPSGKSTIIKMLRLIFRGKQSEDERKTFINALHNNTIQCAQVLVKNATEKFEMKFDDPDAAAAAARVMRLDLEQDCALTEEAAADIALLWKNPVIQATYERRAEFWLLDSVKYYFDNLERFVEHGYVPSEEDTVMARTRTTGLITTGMPHQYLR
jgi:hypothetical protein